MSTHTSPCGYAAYPPATEPETAAALAGSDLMGNSVAIKRLRLQVSRIGPHFRTVLLRGEPGTETELVGRRLHGLSQGAAGQFVGCHAGALEDALPGSSPGDSLEWLVGMASSGTLLLHAVDEMPLDAQARLLRILRGNEFAEARKLTPQRPALRIIASSTEELRVLASTGRFGQELYQRLATVEIVVPPLRERAEDLPVLARTLLDRLAVLHNFAPCSLSPEAMEPMLSYRWPGNRRELENVLRSAMLQSEGGTIEIRHLPVLAEPAPATFAKTTNKDAQESVRLHDVVRRHVLQVLSECAGNKLRAAERLGISRSTLYRMLDTAVVEHGMQ